MAKVTKLKQEFIDSASLILQHRLSIATGGASGESPLDIAKCQQDLHDDILGHLMMVIKSSDLPVEADWRHSSKSEKVDQVLDMIGTGEITPDEGKRLITTIIASLDVELEGMLVRIEELELSEN